MMLTIPLTAVPNQTLTTILGGQNCRINIYQKAEGLFLDLLVAGVIIVSGVVCRDRVFMVRYAYLDFAGDISFIDTHGTDDPYYTGLGIRFKLVYQP